MKEPIKGERPVCFTCEERPVRPYGREAEDLTPSEFINRATLYCQECRDSGACFRGHITRYSGPPMGMDA